MCVAVCKWDILLVESIKAALVKVKFPVGGGGWIVQESD